VKDYILKIRKKLGHAQFIHPAARILIENKNGEILFIQRNDNGKIGLPVGGLEENETSNWNKLKPSKRIGGIF